MIMNIMFNRISKFQIGCSVDGNFANHNLCLIGFRNFRCAAPLMGISRKHNLCLIGFQNFRYAAPLMGISQIIITQDAGD